MSKEKGLKKILESSVESVASVSSKSHVQHPHNASETGQSKGGKTTAKSGFMRRIRWGIHPLGLEGGIEVSKEEWNETTAPSDDTQK